MNRSFSLGSILGIAIKVHWTFFLLVTWIFLASLLSGSDMSAATSQAAFVLLLFGCVVLHELGHALAARCFGIQTEDITLLPIGGLARLERMPRHPFQEIVVALAGPAVNVVIATLLLILIGLPSGGSSAFMGKLLGTGTLEQLVFVNIALVAFNMLPAFPLDGGRVLRALLAIFLDYSVATRSAARLGQVFAVGLGLLGLANPFLLIIALFIFFAASAEASQVTLQERFGARLVRDGMIRIFREVLPMASIEELAPHLLNGTQRDFPVVNSGVVVGLLRRVDILKALESGSGKRVADVMRTDIETVDQDAPLLEVLKSGATHAFETIPVTHRGALVGLFDVREVFEVVRATTPMAEGPSNRLNDESELGTTGVNPGSLVARQNNLRRRTQQLTLTGSSC